MPRPSHGEILELAANPERLAAEGRRNLEAVERFRPERLRVARERFYDDLKGRTAAWAAERGMRW